MSVYLRIEKIYEDFDTVIYKFGSKDLYQKLQINKFTGDISKIETDIKLPHHYYLRAATKIIMHNQSNPYDKYPDLLIYAS